MGDAIANDSVLKEIFFYLDSHGYSNSIRCLQKESGVPFNVFRLGKVKFEGKVVEINEKHFRETVLNGNWHEFLHLYLNGLLLPKELKYKLYEIIVEELIHLHGFPEAANCFLNNSPVFEEMKKSSSIRFLKLKENVEAFNPVTFDQKVAKEGRVPSAQMRTNRQELLQSLNTFVRFTDATYTNELPTALSLLRSSSPGVLKRPRLEQAVPTSNHDEGKKSVDSVWNETYLSVPVEAPKTILKKVECVGEQARISACGLTTLNGKEKAFLCIGKEDGVVDFFDFEGNNNVDPSVGHSSGVLCLNIDEPIAGSAEPVQWVAFGYRDGWIKIYNVASHKLVRKFERAHKLGVTTLCFVGQQSSILLNGHRPFLLSGSFDTTMNLLDIQSGVVLNTITDAHHASFINAVVALTLNYGQCALTAGNEGTLSLWELHYTAAGDTAGVKLERSGHPLPLSAVCPDCAGAVVTAVQPLGCNDTNEASQLFLFSPSGKILLATVNKRSALSEDVGFLQLSVLLSIDTNVTLSSMSFSISAPTLVGTIPTVSLYVSDTEGTILLYNIELAQISNSTSIKRKVQPVDSSAAVILDYGNNVSDLRLVAAHMHKQKHLLLAYSPTLPCLYVLR